MDLMGLDIGAELVLRRGTLRDYMALAEHHYRAKRPATVTRVLVLEHAAPSVTERFLALWGGQPTAARRPQIVGVLVESMPVLACYARDAVLGMRYAGLKDVRQRARRVNAELRCISRVVVHPQWRGLGLAVRLVTAALAEPATIFTQSLAAMGQVNPFLERAGMTAYHPVPRADGRAAPVYYLRDNRGAREEFSRR
jgi:GNAT superfamily N-acetyltransferase